MESSIFEKVNIATFFVQETILSGMYLKRSYTLLQSRYRLGGNRMNSRGNDKSLLIVRRILGQLFAVNLLVLAIDILLISLEVSERQSLSAFA